MPTLLSNAPASPLSRDSGRLDLAPLRLAARAANESQLFEAAAQTLMARGAKGFAVFEILTENQARCRFGATAEGCDAADSALAFTAELQRRLCPTAADAVRLESQQVRLLASEIQLLVVATPVGDNLAAVTWHQVARESDLKGTTWQEDAAAVGVEIASWHSQRAAAIAESQTAGPRWLQAAAQALAKTTLEQAARALAQTLKAELQCDLAALGVRLSPHSPIRLAGASHVGDVDSGSEQMLLLQELMQHSAALKTALRHPAEAEASPAAAKSLQRLAAEGGHQSIVVAPLTVGDEIVGAWIAAGSDRELAERADSRLKTVSPLLGACLTAVARGAASPWSRLRRQAAAAIRGRWAWTVAAGLTLLVLISLLPWPYRLKATCVCEPVVRRFIAAPFEGTLQKVIVRPGDQVVAGEVLAVLDGGELRSELAGLEAKRRQAEQRYSAALASGAAADAHREQLESRHLEMQIQVFQQREGQLEIRSPISGVVVSGDQERAEGAPVTLGQTLFEVAPLDALIAEVEIPESEIRNVESGQQTTLCFDAVPGRHRGALLRVHPRTEMRDDQSVFIAEVELNLPPEARIQPGMHGVARIHTGRRAIGWIWLHRPYWALRRASGW